MHATRGAEVTASRRAEVTASRVAEANSPAFAVLFVCTGNLHRSPLAERLLAGYVPGVEVSSAGTRAVAGARRLTPRRLRGAGLVLGMAREHRDAAVRMWPGVLRRSFTLREFVRLARGGRLGAAAVAYAAGVRGTVVVPPPGADDIADPVGRGPEGLRVCGVEVDAAVRELAGILGSGELARTERTERTECTERTELWDIGGNRTVRGL